jgi:hypothetical protein
MRAPAAGWPFSSMVVRPRPLGNSVDDPLRRRRPTTGVLDRHPANGKNTLASEAPRPGDADAEAHSPRFGLRFIRACQHLLDLDCATNGIEHAREFGEHVVADVNVGASRP